MIEKNDIILAKEAIEYACKNGASAARIALNKNIVNALNTLNGELDKVTRNADSSIFIHLYVDEKYGTFSTNRLVKEELETFINQAISMVRMLSEDEARVLAPIERTAKNAITGLELDLYDPAHQEMNSDKRFEIISKIALSKDELNSLTNDISTSGNFYEVISLEVEYADSLEDSCVITSNGFEGRHTETSFSCYCEATVKDKDGNKFSGTWWTASPKLSNFDYHNAAQKALQKAIAQIGPQEIQGGKYKMVVDRTISNRLISPILNALNGTAIQQKMSFLESKLSEQIFPKGMNLIDRPLAPGRIGSRLYDSEGVATKEAAIIENGVLKQYFINTYIANKMDMYPTIEDVSRPCLKPFTKDFMNVPDNQDDKTASGIKNMTEAKSLEIGEKEINLDFILEQCKSGIYVTGFNGGNSNPVTGDFSFGVEGFVFENGEIKHPVRGLLITGNLLTLWNNLLFAGTDPRESTRWQIPTLAFDHVSFSA